VVVFRDGPLWDGQQLERWVVQHGPAADRRRPGP